MKRLAFAAVVAAMTSGPALAQDFHGYDPATFDGFMLPAENLTAMVAENHDYRGEW